MHDDFNAFASDETDNEEFHAYAQMQYELQPFNVRCHLCGDVDRDTQQNLERKGWMLSAYETCPTRHAENSANSRGGVSVMDKAIEIVKQERERLESIPPVDGNIAPFKAIALLAKKAQTAEILHLLLSVQCSELREMLDTLEGK